jgi:hypothetical protein
MTIRRRVAYGFSGLIVLGAAVAFAWEAHDEPPRARALSAGLVTAYEPCTNPNTLTQGVPPVPACSPPERSDPDCGFGNTATSPGKGKVRAEIRRGEVSMNASVLGLTSGCEGHRLCGVVVLRVTTSRCNAQPCTTQDVELINTGDKACCTVSGGRCHFKAANPSENWDALQDGDRAGAEILGCGLRRVDGLNAPSGSSVTFACGLLSP